MSMTLRAGNLIPEVSAHGFTSFTIKHKTSSMKHGNDIFTVSFTDDQGQEYEMTLYAATPNTDIIVDDATDERIVHASQVALPRGVDLLDAKTYLATRDAYAAESAANEIEERVIDF